MKAKRIDLTVEQGATFDKKINWYGEGKMVREIENVTSGCPTRVTVTAHGLPTGDTPVWIEGVKGARDLNGDEIVATYVDADNFDVPVNTRTQTYTSGTGCIHYIVPKSLAGWTARMDIRDSIDDTTTLVSLTSPTDIVINTTTAEIQILIAASVTAAMDFDEGVYDLELEDSLGKVTRLIYGNVALSKEVTRP